jgi:hypothetical protein
LKHSCGEDEWADILKAVLHQEVHDGIQAAAKVESGQLTVELRRNAAGMTVSGVGRCASYQLCMVEAGSLDFH